MMERGKHRVEVLQTLGEAKHDGRTYRVLRERIVDTGDEYVSIRLYNAQGRFIKRFMLDPEVTLEVGQLLCQTDIESILQRFPHLAKD